MSRTAPTGTPLFGRFLELAIATADIAASMQFYERLGWTALLTGDAWPHRYGVLGDGRVYLGIHERTLDSPAPSFVQPELSRHAQQLRDAGFEPEQAHFGEESLHRLLLRDPGGNPVLLQEARTFSPAPPAACPESLCGYFLHLSLPETDFSAARAFWERAGLVALPEEDTPYPHMPLTSDQLDLALHAHRGCDVPVLAFECVDIPGVLARLRELGITPAPRPPRPLAARGSALLEAPEGTLLLLLPAQQQTGRESAQVSL